MQIAQVTIPQMFASYAATSEDYTPDELIFRCMHCRHDFKIPAPRGGMSAPVFINCPHCKMLICYGISNEDNIWARYDKVAPVTMHLYLYEFKNFVKLLVCGKGLSPAPRGSVSYWREVSYKEEFRFDTQRRKTTWKQSIGESCLQRELCNPKELVGLGQESMLRYLFSHYSIAKHKSEVLNLLRTLRETVREKLERRVGHKVSSFFCPAGSSAGWLLLPIGNIAYRMVFKDASNLPKDLRKLNTTEGGFAVAPLPRQYGACRHPTGKRHRHRTDRRRQSPGYALCTPRTHKGCVLPAASCVPASALRAIRSCDAGVPLVRELRGRGAGCLSS